MMRTAKDEQKGEHRQGDGSPRHIDVDEQMQRCALSRRLWHLSCDSRILVDFEKQMSSRRRIWPKDTKEKIAFRRFKRRTQKRRRSRQGCTQGRHAIYASPFPGDPTTFVQTILVPIKGHQWAGKSRQPAPFRLSILCSLRHPRQGGHIRDPTGMLRQAPDSFHSRMLHLFPQYVGSKTERIFEEPLHVLPAGHVHVLFARLQVCHHCVRSMNERRKCGEDEETTYWI